MITAVGSFSEDAQRFTQSMSKAFKDRIGIEDDCQALSGSRELEGRTARLATTAYSKRNWTHWSTSTAMRNGPLDSFIPMQGCIESGLENNSDFLLPIAKHSPVYLPRDVFLDLFTKLDYAWRLLRRGYLDKSRRTRTSFPSCDFRM